MRTDRIVDHLMEVNELAWSLYNSNPANAPKRNMSPGDIKALIGNFERNHVQYLLIGGFAMAFYGHVRATNDIDLWIKNTRENMVHLRQSLLDLGITEAKALRDTTQLVGGFTVFNLLESDFKIDLLHNLKGFKEVDFDACFKRAKISDYHGMKIPVLSAEDLLFEKKQTGREKDSGDISFLERLLSGLKGEGDADRPAQP